MTSDAHQPHDGGSDSAPWADLADELAAAGRDLRTLIPEVYRGFAALSRASVHYEGALSVKTKELMALVAAVVARCDGCIAAHARGAVRAGATAAEVAEALGVTIQMQGGPGTVYAAKAFAAYREFERNEPTRHDPAQAVERPD